MIKPTITPLAISGLFVVVLSACATIHGNVIPMSGGEYKSEVTAETRKAAMSMASNDAKVTCKKAGKSGFVVISQNDRRDGPEIKTKSKLLNAAISLSTVGQTVRDNTTYEVTTLFKCQ